jgi:two-component sensor histidine kinase
LVGELSHRVKNLITVIQAIVRRTVVSGRTPEEVARSAGQSAGGTRLGA